MKVAVITIYNQGYKAVSDLTIPVMGEYCKRHGYSLLVYADPDCERNICWHRATALMQNLHNFDLLVWMDADSLITNHEIELPQFAQNLITVAKDRNGINDGVMFVKGGEESRKLIQRIWNEDGTSMQDAMQKLYDKDASVSQLIAVVPQQRFNAYLMEEYNLPKESLGNWSPGDFMLHLPALSMDRRVELINEAIPKMIF